MGLQKPPEEENLPASSPTREHDDIAQSGDAAHGDSVMNQGGFQNNPDVNMEFLSKPVAVDEPKSYGVELSGGPKMSAQNDSQPIDAQASSPKTSDKRLQTLGRERIRKPSQQRSTTNDGAAMHRSSESSSSFSSANTGRRSALVGLNSSRFGQMYLPRSFQTPFYGNRPPESSMYFHSPMTYGGFGWPRGQPFYSGQAAIRNQYPVRFGISPPQADQLGTQQRGHYQGPNVHRHPISRGPRHGETRNIPQACNTQESVGRRVRPRSTPTPSARTPRPSARRPEEEELPTTVIHQGTSSAASLDSLQPSGYRCMICHRDVAFTPDGFLSQPSIPPHFEVLRCHHVFHAECLKNNAKHKDQSGKPRCTLCATARR